MKKSDIKIGTIFLNTNKYLSLVYKIENNYVYIINHNGSIYRIDLTSTKDNIIKNYNYISGITTDEFFKTYPEDTINSFNQDKLKTFRKIVKKFRDYSINEEEILLIIK